MAFPTLTAASTAASFSTGSAPGSPRQTGQVRVLGSSSSSASVEQPQKIFVSVSSWTWTSSPMTVARSRAVACAVITGISLGPSGKAYRERVG